MYHLHLYNLDVTSPALNAPCSSDSNGTIISNINVMFYSVTAETADENKLISRKFPGELIFTDCCPLVDIRETAG